MGGGFSGGVIKALFVAGLVLAGTYFVPWKSVKWGKLEIAPSSTISVSGYSESKEKSQIARFSAGVSSVSDSKDEATAFVNQKVEEIISAVKNFGISSDDIKTQSIYVYQQEETYWEEGRQKSRPGQWRVSNSVEVALRKVDKAGELASLLTSSGATNVNGPSFSLDDTQQAETDLLQAAIENAKVKAEIIATVSGKELGEIVNVYEGGEAPKSTLTFGGEMGGGGGAIQPGTGTVTKTVTVTFELK